MAAARGRKNVGERVCRCGGLEVEVVVEGAVEEADGTRWAANF
jgi:hypothetical protein